MGTDIRLNRGMIRGSLPIIDQFIPCHMQQRRIISTPGRARIRSGDVRLPLLTDARVASGSTTVLTVAKSRARHAESNVSIVRATACSSGVFGTKGFSNAAQAVSNVVQAMTVTAVRERVTRLLFRVQTALAEACLTKTLAWASLFPLPSVTPPLPLSVTPLMCHDYIDWIGVRDA